MELIDTPNFFLSQAVTGDGAFGAYLYKIDKRTTPQCSCGTSIQTPEHVFMHCERYKTDRPISWNDDIVATEASKYLINTMKILWEEEKEEEKTGVNCVRRISHRPRRQQLQQPKTSVRLK